MTQPETAPAARRSDRWSLWLIAVAVLAVILFWWGLIANEFLLFLLVFWFGPIIACGIVIVLLVCLFMRRFRPVLSAVVAAAIIAGGVAARIEVRDAARYADFAIHRAGYERAVEVWRAKNAAAVPFRLVLEDVDRSTFVVPTVFDYIVYDESDAIGKNPPVISGIWLCAIPYNPTTRIDGGTIVVKSFGGHFYFIEQTL